MNHVIVDAADAVELIEILEYFLDTLDTHDTLGNQATDTPLRGCRGYHTDDLRADLTRLVDRLNRSPLTS